jgi:3-hydroxypropionate dehydrogenase (NADP+)
MASVGKVPIVVAREYPGHVANRLTAAVWREAIDMLVRRVASAEDIDKAVKYGPGLRWAVQGPFLSYHLGGGEGGIEYFLEQLTPSFEDRWSTLATWTKLPRRAREKIIQNVRGMETIKHASLAALSRERDEQLIQLLRVDKHFRDTTNSN